LNILIKLMSMVSLTVAPLMEGKDDWEDWYFGMVPIAIFVIASAILMQQDILSWSDPLKAIVSKKEDEKGTQQ